MEAAVQAVRCGEFFSGIGAMHLALNEIQQNNPDKVSFDVAVAFDINQVANATYEHNFKLSPTTKLIEHQPTMFYEKLQLDAWLLSPPCQPFTRGGKQLDHLDERSAGLLFLISLLKEIDHKPTYIFLENVLNFEVSECRRLLVEALVHCCYVFEEYLVSPMDIGIPNDRLRYYLIAKLPGSGLVDRPGKPLVRSLSKVYPHCSLATGSLPVRDYLEAEADADETLLVPTKFITDYKNYRHDVVHPDSSRSTTFTKAYGSDYIIGTGSFLQTRRLDLTDYPKDDPEVLLTLRLRFFSPREVARLHAVPETFEFAEGTTRAQRYRLLGNSMNVRVVAILLGRLFMDLE